MLYIMLMFPTTDYASLGTIHCISVLNSKFKIQ